MSNEASNLGTEQVVTLVTSIRSMLGKFFLEYRVEFGIVLGANSMLTCGKLSFARCTSLQWFPCNHAGKMQ
jgi:xanthine/uracil permease